MDGKISGYLFDDKADIIKGDKLYTSGLGGGFIEDLYLGEVNEVISEDEDLMKKIEVKPAINFKKLYKVYVISD
jgi:rod shape-determining protein MreC